ncbi:MAG TPA: glycoside hydrolase family 97 protein [Bacteroidales bacterium]|nr:glycoside hydrolase family 97 protein [Bacteroidales bacterium]
MRKLLLLFILPVLFISQAYSRDFKISSPDGRISVKVTVLKDITWTASYDNVEIIPSARIAMVLAGGTTLGQNESVKKSGNGNHSEIIRPVVPFKKSEIPDRYNYLVITFRSGWSLDFRAYDDGIAYRFETSLGDSLTVKNEVAEIRFPAGTMSWFPYEKSFMSHNENLFVPTSLDTIAGKHLASLPVLFTTGGINILETEANIEEYPGMWLRGAGPLTLKGVWPGYPDREELVGDRNLWVRSVKDYIARTKGTRSFPWRVFAVSSTDGGLLENTLVYRLGSPCRVEDPSWIKPGKVAWDWWNDLNIHGVEFRSGVNMNTYKYYIDFASRNKLDYVILDDGWYKLGNILEVVPGMDIKALCDYAKSRNVGIILWVASKTFDDQMDDALKLYSSWGVKGVKVDFMQRDDQKMVQFYYRAAAKTAEYHMLIDFHGAYKPDGFNRTFPNALTREGVKGLENDKWSMDITPAHDVTLPFTRMVAGPMDYTPGAMINMERENFRPVFSRPASQGTRVHQLALYVVFESPLQMLSDSPSNYEREQECTDFISKVPVVWDDIKVLDARIGEFLLIARRSGKDWYVGGLTNWQPRVFYKTFSFLGEGKYHVEIFKDGINCDRFAQDYEHKGMDIDQNTNMTISVGPGGGYVAKITPIE